jgi:hypothetical protein
MIKDMRRCYNECEYFLSILAQLLKQTSMIKETKIETLKSIAKSLLGIYLLKVKATKEKELGRELSKNEELELFDDVLKRIREGKSTLQRIVSENKLESYLAVG